MWTGFQHALAIDEKNNLFYFRYLGLLEDTDIDFGKIKEPKYDLYLSILKHNEKSFEEPILIEDGNNWQGGLSFLSLLSTENNRVYLFWNENKNKRFQFDLPMPLHSTFTGDEGNTFSKINEITFGHKLEKEDSIMLFRSYIDCNNNMHFLYQISGSLEAYYSRSKDLCQTYDSRIKVAETVRNFKYPTMDMNTNGELCLVWATFNVESYTDKIYFSKVINLPENNLPQDDNIPTNNPTAEANEDGESGGCFIINLIG
jgi:hypothetical protein